MLLDRRSLIGAAAGFAAGAAFRAAAAGQPVGPVAAIALEDFPTLAQRVSGRPLAYLDSAATTLRPTAVIDAIAHYYRFDNANPSATMHALARRAAERYGAARAEVARFINAAPEEIVWVRGTTEAINLAAASWGARLRAGDEILVSIAEHYSNLLPWRALAARTGAVVRTFDVDDEGRLRLDDLRRQLSARTKLVAVTHVSNVLGLINPVAEVAEIAHKVGALVLVDGAQSVPHTAVDVRALGCDFFAFSSHKLLGPMGVGVLWVRRDLVEELPPYQTGSNMAHNVDHDSEEVEHGAAKFQAGTPNVSGPVGLAAAVRYLGALGWPAITAHDQKLVRHTLAGLAGVPGLRVIGPSTPESRVPVFSFTLRSEAVPEIVAALDREGVAVRGGDLAALPLLRRYGVDQAARASAYLYNSTADIDRFIAVVRSLAK